MPIFPGTSDDRFCSYTGDSTSGDCDSSHYTLIVIFQLAFPGVIVGTIVWLCLLVCMISYCCWKCRCPPMPEQKYQFLFGPWIEKGMYKLRLPRALVALLSILTILFCVAIVLTDISVKNATSDFSDGTSSFADSAVSTIDRYQSQVNGLSQSIQKTVSDYRNGASDLKDSMDVLNTVQLIKWIIEIVVCAFLVFASVAGLIAGFWPKRTFFLIVMVISFLAFLPTMLLFSYDVAAEGVMKDLCSELEKEQKGDYAAISFGVLSCDDTNMADSESEDVTLTGIAALDDLLTCKVVKPYAQKNSDHVCDGMMNSGIIGLLSLFMAIVLIFLFLISFGTHGIIGLKNKERKDDEEMNKPRRGYVEGKNGAKQNKRPLGPVAKEGKAHPQQSR